MCYQIMNIMNVLAILIQNTEVIAFRGRKTVERKEEEEEEGSCVLL